MGEKAEGGDEEKDEEKVNSELANEINQKGGSIAVNEDGQVVDKRQLLKGGLNLGSKKPEPRKPAPAAERGPGRSSGGRQGTRERQTATMEDQLLQMLKRSREGDEDEDEDEDDHRATKTRRR